MGNINQKSSIIIKEHEYNRTQLFKYNKFILSSELDNLKIIRISNLKIEEEELVHRTFMNHYLFKIFDLIDRENIIKSSSICIIEKNIKFILEGSFNEFFYIIKEGCFELYIKDKKLETIERGKSFGEEYIFSSPRLYTYIPKEKCTLIMIDCKKLKTIIDKKIISHQEELLTLIMNSKIFRYLEENLKFQLSLCMYKFYFDQNYYIIREGTLSNGIYLIKEGEIEIICSKISNRVLRRGEIFGESSIMINNIRTKDVLSKTKSIVYFLPLENISKIFLGKIKENLIIFITKNIFLNSQYFKKISEKLLESIIPYFKIKYYNKGELVFSEDYKISSKIVIILEGFLLYKNSGKIFCNKNTIFLEKNIIQLDNEQLGNDLIASPDCLLCEMRTEDFIRQTNISFKDLLNKIDIINQLKKIILFRSLANNKLESIEGKLKVEYFNEGQTIIKQGEDGNKLYLIKHGKVDIIVNGNQIRTLNENDSFGERALFFKEPRSATCIAKGFVEVLSLENEDFKTLLETNLKEILIYKLVTQDEKVIIKDLELIKVIHRSKYNKRVYLVKNKKTKYEYALKQIPFEKIIMDKLILSLEDEKNILLNIDHPFIVNLIKVMRDDFEINELDVNLRSNLDIKNKNYYLLMEYIKGKNLFDCLREIGILNKQQSQFYIAIMLIIADYLHNKNLIYRDFKPNNFIVKENGYLKLVDFSTCIEVDSDRKLTIVGSPHYMCPEAILGKSFSYEYDIWSICICLYEFHCGKVPFGDGASDPMEIFIEVLEKNISFPNFVKDKDFMSFIKITLNKDPKKRITKFNQIKAHPYFKDYKWNNIVDLTIDPLYKPKISYNNYNKENISALNYINNNPLINFENKDQKFEIDNFSYDWIISNCCKVKSLKEEKGIQ